MVFVVLQEGHAPPPSYNHLPTVDLAECSRTSAFSVWRVDTV